MWSPLILYNFHFQHLHVCIKLDIKLKQQKKSIIICDVKLCSFTAIAVSHDPSIGIFSREWYIFTESFRLRIFFIHLYSSNRIFSRQLGSFRSHCALCFFSVHFSGKNLTNAYDPISSILACYLVVLFSVFTTFLTTVHARMIVQRMKLFSILFPNHSFFTVYICIQVQDQT